MEEKKKDRKKEYSAARRLSLRIGRRIAGADESGLEIRHSRHSHIRFFRVQGKSSPQNPTFLQDLLINSTLAISQSILEIFFQPVSSVRGSARHPSWMKGAGSSSQGAFGCDAAAFAASSELDNFSFCISQSSLATKHSDTPFRKPFAFLLPCLVFFVIVIVVGLLSYLISQWKFR